MSEDRYRLVVLGSAKVGKTSLIRQYLYREFSEKYKETIEDLHSRQFRIQGVPLHLDILDTNFNFPDMRKIAVTSASAFMLVFSVDDVQTFKEMSDLWQEIHERRPDLPSLPVVVVGNKSDLASKKIYEATAVAFTSRLSSDVRYIEVSAKTNHRVTEVFRTLLKLSGFPKCKAGGGSLEDGDGSPVPNEPEKSSALRRVNTTRARPMDRASTAPQDQTRNDRGLFSSMDKQTSNPALTIPIITDLKRNRSLRGKSPRNKDDLERKNSDEGRLSRSSSLIRRTKHLSLKMRRHGEEVKQDESDCNIQ